MRTSAINYSSFQENSSYSPNAYPNQLGQNGPQIRPGRHSFASNNNPSQPPKQAYYQQSTQPSWSNGQPSQTYQAPRTTTYQNQRTASYRQAGSGDFYTNPLSDRPSRTLNANGNVTAVTPIRQRLQESLGRAEQTLATALNNFNKPWDSNTTAYMQRLFPYGSMQDPAKKNALYGYLYNTYQAIKASRESGYSDISYKYDTNNYGGGNLSGGEYDSETGKLNFNVPRLERGIGDDLLDRAVIHEFVHKATGGQSGMTGDNMYLDNNGYMAQYGAEVVYGPYNDFNLANVDTVAMSAMVQARRFPLSPR